MSQHSFTWEDESGAEWTVEYGATKYVPAFTSGPPDRCYPAEGGIEDMNATNDVTGETVHESSADARFGEGTVAGWYAEAEDDAKAAQEDAAVSRAEAQAEAKAWNRDNEW